MISGKPSAFCYLLEEIMVWASFSYGFMGEILKNYEPVEFI